MMDLKAAVLAALDSPDAAPAWPRAEGALPRIAVADDQISVSAQADGAPYLYEHIVQISVYAADQAALETLFGQVHDAMNRLGLRLLSARDLYDETAYAWRKELRYRCLAHNDLIYQ